MSRAKGVTATVAVPWTCGEVLQGVDARGPLLVSLPLARSASVSVTLRDGGPVTLHPARARAARALRLALDELRWRGGASAVLDATMPVARGYGSSTVDVAGVIAAAFAAAGTRLEDARLLRLMTAVEPSDSSPFAGLVAIDHVDGSRLEPLGRLPALWLAVVDTGERVDTLRLHARSGPGVALPAGIMSRLRAALSRGDVAELGRVATESAMANQQRLAHPALAALAEVTRGAGGAGVAVAHSGCLAAGLFSDRGSAQRAAAALSAAGWGAGVLAASGGGLRPCSSRQPLARDVAGSRR